MNITGLVLSSIGATILILVNIVFPSIDHNYDVVKHKITSAEKLCAKIDSVPRSYDQYTITCENGTQISMPNYPEK